MSRAVLYCGDALAILQTLPENSVQCVVTSPPYWGLRDYGMPGQLGLEPGPVKYVAGLVAVFREVRRVLRDDGTLWLNLGDSYAGSWGAYSYPKGDIAARRFGNGRDENPARPVNSKLADGLKAKDMVGIPWRAAFALQADGWWLRSDIVWEKPNPMPESITDRPTKAHEYVFLLSKSERYVYDADAIAEPSMEEHAGRYETAFSGSNPALVKPGGTRTHPKGMRDWKPTRNARTVWKIATAPYAGAHFATFPEELARRCIAAGSRPGDTVLDPFGGSGTVAQVATGNSRSSIYIDLNPAYLELARQRIGSLLCDVA